MGAFVGLLNPIGQGFTVLGQPNQPGRIAKRYHGDRARRLGTTYRKLLRRAAKTDWQAAKLQYLRRETKNGMSKEDVLDDLDVIERQYFSTAIRGTDPVVSQRRSDVDIFVASPLAFLVGSLVVGALAVHEIGTFPAISLACLAAFVVRKLSNSIARVLVE